jgi:hypothetical protein
VEKPLPASLRAAPLYGSVFCGVLVLASANSARADYREVTGTDSTDTAAEPEADPSPPAEASPSLPVAAAVQGFLVVDKVMPGVALRVGETWGARLEASLLWTTRPPPDIDAFLGNQFGIYLEATPLRSQRFDLSLGAGSDIYYLWGVHGDLLEFSLSVEANASYWFTPSFGGLLGIRAYPLASSGLELGTARSGASGSPVLVTLGVQWRSQ